MWGVLDYYIYTVARNRLARWPLHTPLAIAQLLTTLPFPEQFHTCHA
jgi:hypothetical protein